MLKQSSPDPLRRIVSIFSITVVLAAAAWIPRTSAADLVLKCAVTAKGADRKQSQLTKRIDVIVEPRYFERYRDDGKRLRLEKEGFPVFISRAMIVFQEEDTIKETYDRNTGDYSYENLATGRQVIGHCDKVVDRTQERGRSLQR